MDEAALHLIPTMVRLYPQCYSTFTLDRLDSFIIPSFCPRWPCSAQSFQKENELHLGMSRI